MLTLPRLFSAFTDPPPANARESLFSYFTQALIPTLPPVPHGPAIMLTGGLHDRALIASCIRSRACDLVGIARAAALVPDLPHRVLLNQDLDASKARVNVAAIPHGDLVKCVLGGGGMSGLSPGRIKLVGASVSTFWFEWQMAAIGRGEDPDPALDWISGIFHNWLWYDLCSGGPVGWYKRWMGEW